MNGANGEVDAANARNSNPYVSTITSYGTMFQNKTSGHDSIEFRSDQTFFAQK